MFTGTLGDAGVALQFFTEENKFKKKKIKIIFYKDYIDPRAAGRSREKISKYCQWQH